MVSSDSIRNDIYALLSDIKVRFDDANYLSTLIDAQSNGSYKAGKSRVIPLIGC
jgi:hypothetical protein